MVLVHGWLVSLPLSLWGRTMWLKGCVRAKLLISCCRKGERRKRWGEGKRERERQRQTERERERQRQRHTQMSDIKTETEIHRKRETK